MKTVLIVINRDSVINDGYACGLCFTETGRKQKFCTECGAKFVRQENDNCCSRIVFSYEELKEANESLSPEEGKK